MPQHCCVPRCSSNSSKHEEVNGHKVGFHSFPGDPGLSKCWVVNIRRDVNQHFALNAFTKVCSLHFADDAFYPGEGQQSGQAEIETWRCAYSIRVDLHDIKTEASCKTHHAAAQCQKRVRSEDSSMDLQ